MKRSRARSAEDQLTCNRFKLVPGFSHLFLYQAVPFSSGSEVVFLSLSREYDRPGSPLERMLDDVAMHQLLSGQLARRPTPMVSYLYDCGDRGLRPF